MIVVRFYVWVIRIGIALAMLGQLKTCTLVMAGLAAEKSERGIMSYGKFSRALTAEAKITKARSTEQRKAASPSP
jgi:hypothetical protein